MKGLSNISRWREFKVDQVSINHKFIIGTWWWMSSVNDNQLIGTLNWHLPVMSTTWQVIDKWSSMHLCIGMITYIDIEFKKSDEIDLANILLTYIPNQTLMRWDIISAVKMKQSVDSHLSLPASDHRILVYVITHARTHLVPRVYNSLANEADICLLPPLLLLIICE